MALKEMTTVLDAEREVLELDSIPEYLTDAHLPSRELAASLSSRPIADREIAPVAPVQPVQREQRQPIHAEPEHPKSDELEALWPGVHHELHHSPRRPSSFYLTVGFMAGAFASMIGVFTYSAVSGVVAHNDSSKTNIASIDKQSQQKPLAVRGQDGSEVLTPSAGQYQVQPGDTLAGIALKNYKHVSPRLLDEICKANNMRNANVLSLGQKLNLPEYRSQPAQIAGAGQIQ